MRKSYYAFAAVAALTVMGLCTERASAQYYYSSGYSYAPNTYYVPAYSYGYAPTYGYSYAPAYSYAYTPSYSYGYSYPAYSYGYSPRYYGGGGVSFGYYSGPRVSGYSVGIGPVSYTNLNYNRGYYGGYGGGYRNWNGGYNRVGRWR